MVCLLLPLTRRTVCSRKLFSQRTIRFFIIHILLHSWFWALRFPLLCHLCVLGSWAGTGLGMLGCADQPSGVVPGHDFSPSPEWLPCCSLFAVRCPLSVLRCPLAAVRCGFCCFRPASVSVFEGPGEHWIFHAVRSEHNAWELAQLFRPQSVNKIFTASERDCKRNCGPNRN